MQNIGTFQHTEVNNFIIRLQLCSSLFLQCFTNIASLNDNHSITLFYRSTLTELPVRSQKSGHVQERSSATFVTGILGVVFIVKQCLISLCFSETRKKSIFILLRISSRCRWRKSSDNDVLHFPECLLATFRYHGCCLLVYKRWAVSDTNKTTCPGVAMHSGPLRLLTVDICCSYMISLLTFAVYIWTK